MFNFRVTDLKLNIAHFAGWVCLVGIFRCSHLYWNVISFTIVATIVGIKLVLYLSC